jgi:glycosyltransferase involved in cell wall biosynthesis
MYQYLPYLASHGIEVESAPFLSNAYVTALYSGEGRGASSILQAYARRLRALRRIDRYDLIWIEKEAMPWMPAWAERRIRRHKIPYIADYDDATFHNYDENKRAVIRRVLGHKIDEVMRGAAIVVAGNDYLADRARSAGSRRIEIIPTVVDLNHYPLSNDGRNDVFTIGWIGTPVTAPYLRVAQEGLATGCRDGGARLVAVGSGPIELENVPTEVREWREESEAADMRSVDAGIMPLPDESWERGKCGYKLIQYMACAKPVVASPVGVNRQIIDAGCNGYLASTPEEWARALCALRDDADLCAGMGKAAREKVERFYSLQITSPRMVQLFREAAQ